MGFDEETCKKNPTYIHNINAYIYYEPESCKCYYSWQRTSMGTLVFRKNSTTLKFLRSVYSSVPCPAPKKSKRICVLGLPKNKTQVDFFFNPVSAKVHHPHTCCKIVCIRNWQL